MNGSARPPRIIVVAENASTGMGGEAILPYHYFRVLRERGLDAWLCVHERCRAELLALFPDDHARLLFVRDRRLQKLLFRLSNYLPRRVAEASLGLANQMLTQSAQREAIRPLARGYAVVHQPIPVAPRFPSLMYGLPCPVVIGPLNGGMEFPPAFRGSEGLVSRVAIACGRALTDAVNAWLPGKREAAAVLVANERTRAALPSELQGRVLTMAENGVEPERWAAVASAGTQRESNGNVRFVFVGRLVDWKRLDIVLQALEANGQAALDVIGDGPMLPVWRQLAQARGLTQRVAFHGWLPQSDAAALLSRARALLLPSLYESGGAVVLEAMAAAKPVVATAWGGPCEYLDPCCGILIRPESEAALVQGFRDAMQRLATDCDLAVRMGQAGRAKVLAQYDWNRKVDAMLLVYAEALNAGDGR